MSDFSGTRTRNRNSDFDIQGLKDEDENIVKFDFFRDERTTFLTKFLKFSAKNSSKTLHENNELSQ